MLGQPAFLYAETLVHSTLIGTPSLFFFNVKEHTVYVKQWPYLHAFLETVAEMFEVDEQ